MPRTIKERRKISLLPDIYSDTLDTDFSVDVPVRRMAQFSTLTFDVPVRPMDAKGLTVNAFQHPRKVKGYLSVDAKLHQIKAKELTLVNNVIVTTST